MILELINYGYNLSMRKYLQSDDVIAYILKLINYDVIFEHLEIKSNPLHAMAYFSGISIVFIQGS